MAKVSPVIPFSNKLGNFSVYKMKDVDKLVFGTSDRFRTYRTSLDIYSCTEVKYLAAILTSAESTLNSSWSLPKKIGDTKLYSKRCTRGKTNFVYRRCFIFQTCFSIKLRFLPFCVENIIND